MSKFDYMVFSADGYCLKLSDSVVKEYCVQGPCTDFASLNDGIDAQTGSFAMLERFGIEIPRPTYLFMPRYSGETLAKRFIHETKVIHKGELFL